MAEQWKGVFSADQWVWLTHTLHLSPKQELLAHNLMLGRSDKQIARDMGIAVATVRSHMTRMFHKFDVNDRVELILYFVGYLRECQANAPAPAGTSHPQGPMEN